MDCAAPAPASVLTLPIAGIAESDCEACPYWTFQPPLEGLGDRTKACERSAASDERSFVTKHALQQVSGDQSNRVIGCALSANYFSCAARRTASPMAAAPVSSQPAHRLEWHTADTGRRPEHFDAEELLRLTEGTALATYQPGEIIHSQGYVPDSVRYVLEGGVKLSVLSRSGKEAVIAMLEAVLTSGGVRSRSRMCSSRTCSRGIFASKRRRGRSVARIPGEKRLARALLLLARRRTPGETHRVLPRFLQQTLADMVGAPPPGLA